MKLNIDILRSIQASIDERFAELTPNIKEIEMGYLDIIDKQNKNLTIPFSMAIVYIANYADYFLKDYQTLVWNKQFTNFICDNILNK